MHRTSSLTSMRTLILCPPSRARFCSLALRNYHFNLLNLKIGYTKNVELHPDSDKLYVSQIKLDQSDGSKQICSGLRQYLPRESFQDRFVVVVDNMKKCKLRGQLSEGMILCGESASEDKVSLCTVSKLDPELVGKNVVLRSSGEPTGEPTSRKIKTKEWEDISSRLKVGEGGKVVYRDEEDAEETYLCVYNGDGEAVPVIAEGLPSGSPVK